MTAMDDGDRLKWAIEGMKDARLDHEAVEDLRVHAVGLQAQVDANIESLKEQIERAQKSEDDMKASEKAEQCALLVRDKVCEELVAARNRIEELEEVLERTKDRLMESDCVDKILELRKTGYDPIEELLKGSKS